MNKPKSRHERRKYWLKFVESLGLDVDADAFRLMNEMHMVTHAIKQIGENSLAAAGLSMAQYRILTHLLFSKNVFDEDVLNPSEISDHLGVSRNTISSLIRSLEDKDLIQRKLDTNDRRKFKISLTSAGTDLVTRYAGHHMHNVSHCFTVLNEDERKQFSSYLNRLSNQIENGRNCAKETNT
ncbi:MAG: MarR family transcriptional regulator [Chloroflexi bacterium]|nr:MAG: MarR family transcriptional regulator [Chloroflexota bacterium]